ncbi:DUF535 family protein [Ramlibacter sp.]|uniref:DUF535 family protein n=1 Tax=Ramlibacter sp. TaxID=1917967 RepID=UPI0035AFF2C9
MSRADPTPVPSVLRGLAWAWQRGGKGARRWRFLGRALRVTLIHGSALARWMAVVVEQQSRGMVHDLPGEYLRAVRPSINRHTGVSQRVLQLIEHVDWLETAIQPAFLEQLMRGVPLVLAELPPPRGYDFIRLQLELAPARLVEGELLLTLQMQRSADLQQAASVQAAVLAFSHFRVQGKGCLLIGGVRGQRDPVNRVSRIELGQALAGWRPSVLLVRVMQELAARWRLELVGLDPAAHRLQGWTSMLSARRRDNAARIYASYDSLWEHFGARKGPPGWLVLPRQSDEKLEATDLSPEKRESQMRRADFWIRTRKLLRTRLREVLHRGTREARLSRNTQSLQPPEWDRHASEVSVRGQRREAEGTEEDMVPSRLVETSHGPLR